MAPIAATQPTNDTANLETLNQSANMASKKGSRNSSISRKARASANSAQLNMSMELLSVEAEECESKPGEGRPRRHPLVRDGKFVDTFDPECLTLFDTFTKSAAKFGSNRFLGWRPKVDGVAQDYEWMSYSEAYERVNRLAAGLAHYKLPKQTSVGIYSINRLEWVLVEYACYFQNLVPVPLYDTLGDEAMEHICNQTEMPIIVASSDKTPALLRLKPKISNLKTIIIMDGDLPDDLIMKGLSVAVEFQLLSSVEQMGSEVCHGKSHIRKPSPDDLCTICYTSGTTGLPKGAMIPHRAAIADASSVLTLCGIGQYGESFEGEAQSYLFRLDEMVVHLSFLPLAHIYERIVVITLAAVGAAIGFYQGEVLKLLDDLTALKPTLFCAVPRLLNRIHDKIMAGVAQAGPIQRLVFNLGYRVKLYHLRRSGTFRHWLWDRVVFNSIKNRLGGRVEAILSGSAPVSPEVLDFLRICFSCEVYEGYGQTETAAATTLTGRGDWTPGQVGLPTPCQEIKLVDVPEMNYTSQDVPFPRGEICIRGANCFIGYYREPELTKATMDEDGWVHTGDIGMWDERGRLRIIDRKKNIFKLAQGEYISPEKIENALSRMKHIAQAYVEGNSLKASLVAVIVPDFETLMPWASEHNLPTEDKAALCRRPEVAALLMEDLKMAKEAGLKGFEIPRKIFVEHVAFSIENGLLTPSFKLKRNEAKKYYGQQIADMYAQLSE